MVPIASPVRVAAPEPPAAADGHPRSARLQWFRHQLPVASPIAPGAVVATALGLGRSEAVDRLSRLLRDEYAADEVALTGSGTQALQLAIELAWQKGGRRGSVALPAFACFDLASAAIGAGVPVSFFDIEPQSLGPDLDSLERALRGGASVVVVAPLYGIPVAWSEVAQLCGRYGAVAIEDAAQGQGSSWAGQPLGSHGILSVLSFGRGKGWSGGGGGALLLRGDAGGFTPGDRLGPASDRRLPAVFKLGAQWAIGRPTLYGVAAALPGLNLGETVYHAPALPRKMSAARAAAVLAHHGIAQQYAERRRVAAEGWAEAVARIAGFGEIPVPDGGRGGYLRFPLLAPVGFEGFRSLSAARRAGIAPSYPRALPRLPEISASATGAADGWPGADELARRLITLPTHWQVSPGDHARVLDLLRSYQPRGTA